MQPYLRHRLAELILSLETSVARTPDRRNQLALGLLMAADEELEKKENEESRAGARAQVI